MYDIVFHGSLACLAQCTKECNIVTTLSVPYRFALAKYTTLCGRVLQSWCKAHELCVNGLNYIRSL